MAAKYYDTLSDTGRIKTGLMSLFCNTKDIARLIMPAPDNDTFTWEQNWYGGSFDRNDNGKTETVKLAGHCFDIPYTEGIITDNRCAVFIESYLTKIINQRIKETKVEVCVLCHKDSLRLSDEDMEYYNAKGIYGNRIDSAIQMIHTTIINPATMDSAIKKYSIGNMNLSEENPLKQHTAGTGFYGKCLSYTYQSFYQRNSR